MFQILLSSHLVDHSSILIYKIKRFSTTTARLRRDLYETLGISHNASQDEVKEAFYDLSKKHHPDLVGSNTTSNKKFLTIKAAYDVLRDEKKRTEYDNSITKRQQNSSFQMHSLSKSKRNDIEWRQQQQQSQNSQQMDSATQNMKIFSFLSTKERNPFFDKLMLEDAWRRTKKFGLGFVIFILIYYIFVRKVYLRK
ncbi:hypothetical protein ACQ4LE_009819 [Meloidogyne hapla]|uniref:J domain-containing protein n=1 Tax=Meloidogyne hapla TaxID=6305 RepID=A0A1I8AX77_MELHA